MSQKTLFNYFTKSPAVAKKENGIQNGISKTPPSKTPESKKIESSKKQNIKSDSKTPKSSRKDKTDLKTPVSSKKRSRQNSLGKFSSTPVNKKLKTEEGIVIELIEGIVILLIDINIPDEPKNESEIEESPGTPPMKKRRRIIEELSSEDADSGDDYVPGILFFRFVLFCY